MTDIPNRRAVAGAILTGSAALLLTTQPAHADTDSLEKRLRVLEDRAALKELVDTFSNLADIRDVDTQVQLFTEDATVTSITDGQTGSSFTGRSELARAFGGVLAQFDTITHINGQQTVQINGDRASGTAYCLVTLIRTEDGQRIWRTSGVRYEDQYLRDGERWLIAGRTSHFEWTDTVFTPV